MYKGGEIKGEKRDGRNWENKMLVFYFWPRKEEVVMMGGGERKKKSFIMKI